MNPKKYTTNISGYRCNADREKIQVRVENATNVCKKLCYDNADCKGYYTKQPVHFNRNTICNLCTGKAKNPTLKRSSNVNDYNIIINRCNENYKLSEDGIKCIHIPDTAQSPPPPPPPPPPPSSPQFGDIGDILPNKFRPPPPPVDPNACIMAPYPGKCGRHLERGLSLGYNKCNRYLDGSPAYCDMTGICRAYSAHDDRGLYNSDDTMCATLEKDHKYTQGTFPVGGITLYTEANFKGDINYYEGSRGQYIPFERTIYSFKKKPNTPHTLILRNGICVSLSGVGNVSKIPKRKHDSYAAAQRGGYDVVGIYFGDTTPNLQDEHRWGYCKARVFDPIREHGLEGEWVGEYLRQV